MNILEDLRVAWLIPSAASGAHWQPIWSRFVEAFPNTVFYTTSVWKEFDSSAHYAKSVKIFGKFKPIFLTKRVGSYGYRNGLMRLPFSIIYYLWITKPNIVIANAFSIWSILAVGLKLILRYKLIILYEGSTPNSDSKNSIIRSSVRKLLSPFIDVFIANNQEAKLYLKDYLKIDESRIYCQSYLVPEKEALLSTPEAYREIQVELKQPIFIFIGQLLQRKGLFQLLEASNLLKQKTNQNFSVLIIGDGPEQKQLQQCSEDLGLGEQFIWLGRCPYGCLGLYLKKADVFIFPSLEDSWGMVVLEAMAFGKPILCSKEAGVSEMVAEGENGYLFDPFNPNQLAELMQQFIERPTLISTMGKESQQLAIMQNPNEVVLFFQKIISKINMK